MKLSKSLYPAIIIITILLFSNHSSYSAPQNISINYADSTVTLDWDELTGADKYYIYGGTDPESLSLLDSSLTNSWNTTLPDSRYFFQVSGVAIDILTHVYVSTDFEGGTQTVRDADITLRTFDDFLTPETQTQPLNGSGGAYFQFYRNPLAKTDYLFELKVDPYPTSWVENATIDTVYAVLEDQVYWIYKLDLKKIAQAKRITGTVRGIEDMVGISNAKVVVSKMMEDGSFKDLDSTFTDALGEYMTNRISIQDSLYLKIAKEGYVNTVVDGEDKGSFISRFPMTARINRADTLQTGKYFQNNIDFIMIPNWVDHPLYADAIAEQVTLGNNITELTNNMFVEGRTDISCQAWRNGERLGIYLVPGQFTSAERDSMVLWLDKEAKVTGFANFEAKYEELLEQPTDSNASWLRVIKGDNVFSGWEYDNSASVAPGYAYDVITRGGDVETYLDYSSKNEMLKELTSRVTKDNTVLTRSNSNAIPTHVTKTDQIFRNYNLKMDANRTNMDKRDFIRVAAPYSKQGKREFTEIMAPTKAEKNNKNYLRKNQRNSKTAE